MFRKYKLEDGKIIFTLRDGRILITKWDFSSDSKLADGYVKCQSCNNCTSDKSFIHTNIMGVADNRKNCICTITSKKIRHSSWRKCDYYNNEDYLYLDRI